MGSSLVVTLAVIAAVAWLAFIGVAALRSRGPEEIGPNQAPGTTDDVLETRRLERVQMAAVLLAGFLAVSLPLYYLSEPTRQEGFVHQFDEESVARGAALVESLKCFSCHGPNGSGGNAPFVEKRSGVQVAWTAPPLDTVFLRYGHDEVKYWITYGRGNTPMPAWGTPGGGPLNDSEVEDIINYLHTVQIPQEEAAARVPTNLASAQASLAAADDAIAGKILEQRQIIANLERAPELETISKDISERAQAALDGASNGIDTDGDGLSDASEEAINLITAEAKQAWLLPGLENRSFDPNNSLTNGIPDLDAANEFLASLRDLSRQRAPILADVADKVEAAIASTDGPDTDGDGLVDSAETQLTAFVSVAQSDVLPSELVVTNLDPTKVESQGGQPDATTAEQAVAALGTIALNTQINAENGTAKLIPNAQAALDNLLAAQSQKLWAFDVQGVADSAFDGDTERAQRTIDLFEAYCARCHTSGYSAGVILAQEAGSGGFAPAIYRGRAAIQFLSDDDLKAFLIVGGEANKPYGVNGMGKENAPMPAFGKILSDEDLADLAHWLRVGNLTGKGAG